MPGHRFAYRYHISPEALLPEAVRPVGLPLRWEQPVLQACQSSVELVTLAPSPLLWNWCWFPVCREQQGLCYPWVSVTWQQLTPTDGVL